MAQHSKFYVPALLAGMLITGSSNSLWSKWQDMQCVEDCDGPNPITYSQPFWQTLQMFAGEMLCFLPVLYTWAANKWKKAPVQLPSDEETPKPFSSAEDLDGLKVLLLWIPALCDLTGTTLMNIGLLYTPVSIYQMSRGALVLFVGALSVMFLRRVLRLYQWLSLLIVMLGVCLVGLSGSMIKDEIKDATETVLLIGRSLATGAKPPPPTEQPETTAVLVGVFFILFAQIFTATQFVVEEKIMSRYSVAPLVAVGWEGFFGAFSILVMMPALGRLSHKSPFFDLPRGWHQTIDTPSVLYSGMAIACSIALFNFFGLSVTRHVSATARSLTDTCRTLVIWIISLGLGWEKLLFPISLLQVLGFSLLVYGTFLFNNIVPVPSCLPQPTPLTEHDGDDEEAQGLLSGSQIDETATLPADLGQSGYDVLPQGEHVITPQPKQRNLTSA